MSAESRRRFYLRQMDELRVRYGNRCSKCGRSETEARFLHRNGLEFAHLVTTGLNGRGRGRADRIHDIRRNPSHYTLMCVLCHREFDAHEGPRLPEEAPF
jgi:hypothetical protein